MDLLLINLFSNILDTILILYYLVIALSKKDIDLKKTAVLVILLVIFNTIINTGFGSVNFIGFLIILTVLTIVYSYILNEPIANLIIHSLSAAILMGVIEMVSITFICLVFNVIPSTLLEVNIYRILAIVLAKTILFLTIKYLLRKIKIPRFINFRFNISVVLIFLFNLFMLFMAYNVYKYLKNQTIVEYLNFIGLALGTIIYNWLIYKITKESIYRSQQEIIWKMKEEKFYKKNFYINNMKDILQTIRAQRHELNNYLSILYGLICLEDFDKVKEYISKINDRLSGMNSIIETNNPIITAIISIQKNKAFNEGIEMDLDIDELPEELPFDSLDLSIIIGNLLNNAMEACLSLGKDQVRKIQFYMWIEKEKLTIHIKNTKSNLRKLDVKEILGRFTTKEDKEKHGFGLSNVDFIVNQYNGILNLEDLGDEFVVDVTLPMNRDLKNDVKATT